ncbi:hypothetical protein BsWGS_05954 [Bradybaena similaris]
MECGFDVTFASELDQRFQCPICLLALRNPVQTACGHRFCSSCIKKTIPYRNTVLTCPVDKTYTKVNQMFQDLATEREILSLQVMCTNVLDDCIWRGELRALENHRLVCEVEQLLCANGCATKIKRMDVDVHEGHCTHRMVQCSYCPEKVILYRLKEHKDTCPKLPVACTLCCTILPREDLQKHQEPNGGQCTKTIIACPYKDIGCRFETERQLMAEHLHKSEIVQEHLNLALQRIVKMDRTVQDLSKTLANVEEKDLSLIPMLMQNDKKHKTATSELRERNVTGKLHWKIKLNEMRRCSSYTSPAFYTGCPGYKVQLTLDMEGPREGGFKYTKLTLALLPGDYDHQVIFPFNGTCIVTLFDQVKCHPQQKTHHVNQLVVREVPRNSSGSCTYVDRIYKRDLAKYVKCADLVGSNSRYLRNNCLHIEAVVIHSYYPAEGTFVQGCICTGLMPHGLEMAVTPKRPITTYSDASTQAQSAQIMQLSAISIGN